MNKKIVLIRIFSAAAVLLWMAVIFRFSAQNGKTSGNVSGGIIKITVSIFNPDFDTLPESHRAEIVSTWQTAVRKTAHFSEYALLGFLTAAAFHTYKLKRVCRWLLPPAVCLLYAVSDEVHQLFVPGRAGRALDVMIDSAGGIFGTAVFMCLAWLIVRFKLRKELKNDTENRIEG